MTTVKIQHTPEGATPTRGSKRRTEHKDSVDRPPQPPKKGGPEGVSAPPGPIDYAGIYSVNGPRIVREGDGLTLLRVKRPNPGPKDTPLFLTRLIDGRSKYVSSVWKRGSSIEFENDDSSLRYRIETLPGDRVKIVSIGVPTRKAKGWTAW